MTEATNETSLVIAADLTAVDLYTAEKMDILLEEIRKKVELVVLPDASTGKGRKEIIALAYEVTQTKTMIEKGGLKITEQWRQDTKTVNQSKKTASEFLSELAKDIRNPVTEWEHKESERQEAERITEERRISAIREKIASISAIPIESVGKNYVQIVERLYELEDILVNEDGYQEFTSAAWSAKSEAVEKMRALRDAVQVQEEAKKKSEQEAREREEEDKERKAKQQAEDAERRKRLEEEEAKLKEEREEFGRKLKEMDDEKSRIAAEKKVEVEEVETPEEPESTPDVNSQAMQTLDNRDAAITSLSMIINDEDIAEMAIDAIISGDVDHVSFRGTVK